MRKRVVYYIDERGHNPVWEFISTLSPDEQNKCLEYIDRLDELGEQIRRPLGDYLGGKLYELRPKQTRILYFFMFQDYAVLIHAFRKKTWEVPECEQRKALKIMKSIITHYQQGQIQFGAIRP